MQSVRLARGGVKAGAGARIAGKFSDEALVGRFCVGEAAGFELGLAEGKLRCGRFWVERHGFTKCGDGRVILLQSHVSGARPRSLRGSRGLARTSF